jgi:hypothetical protein
MNAQQLMQVIEKRDTGHPRHVPTIRWRIALAPHSLIVKNSIKILSST